MELTFDRKSIYGKTLYYPTNLQAKAITDIAGRKTLSIDDINELHGAGFKVITTNI